MALRILIADDHAVVADGVRYLLAAQSDLEVVGTAADGTEAVQLAQELAPDVILLDIVMPDQTGLDVLPQLRHENPDAKVLILSMQDEPRYVREESVGLLGMRERLSFVDGRLEIESRRGAGTTIVAEVPLG